MNETTLEERIRELEEALRLILDEIDPRSGEWLMSNPPQHAPCYAARRIAREALAPLDSEPAEGAGGGKSFGSTESVFADYSPAAYQGGRISAMDVFADAEDEIERIRLACWDAGISGIDRLCDFARAAWQQRDMQRVTERAAERQDAMLERREALFYFEQLIDGCKSDRWSDLRQHKGYNEVRRLLSRTSDEGGVPEAVRRLPNQWRSWAMDGNNTQRVRAAWACADELDRALAEQGGQRVLDEDVSAKYHELLYAVETKHPGESRHETALRYIQQAEECPTHCEGTAPQPENGESDE